MSTIIEVHQSPYGELTIEPAALQTGNSSGLVFSRRVIRWRPPPEFLYDVPSDCAVEVQEQIDQAGNRRILPLHGYDILVAQAYLGGLALLKEKRLTPQELFDYRAYWLASQWLRARGAKLRRSFSSTRDLVITRSGRGVVGRGDALPEELGLDSAGNGRRWSIEVLIERGYEAARAAGIDRPDDSDVIAHGLMQAAALNPLHLTRESVYPLVRMALYAPLEEAMPEREIRDEVASRLSKAWEEHQEDSQAKFNAWCWGNHSNLPKSLANRRTREFGPIPQSVVTRVLHELGWEGLRAISNCLHASLKWLKNCLSEDLTPEASVLFDQIYLPQPIYGDLPLVLLMDRAIIIKPVVLELWANPEDATLAGILHRMLQYYEQMVEIRRSADCERKNVRQARLRKTPRIPCIEPTAVPGGPPSTAIRSAGMQSIGQLLRQIAAQKNLRCSKCGAELQLTRVDDDLVAGQPLEFRATCKSHPDYVHHVEVPWDDAISAVAELNKPFASTQTGRKRPGSNSRKAK